MLLTMRYKGFVWPNNPRTYTLSCKRQTATQMMPMQGFAVQDLGRSCLVLRGEGEFFGSGAYAQFKELLGVFAQDGPGVLIHPMWQTNNAFFTNLKLTQEPREDYVAYSFEFCEALPGSLGEQTQGALQQTNAETGLQPRKIYHPMGAGETLWTVASKYMLTMTELLRMNPEIDNPNHVQAGQKVRIQ